MTNYGPNVQTVRVIRSCRDRSTCAQHIVYCFNVHILKWDYLIVDANMEVVSSDDVGLVEVLDRFRRGLDMQFSFLCGKEAPPQSSLASREERSRCEKVGMWVAPMDDPLLPGEFGLYSRTSTIHEGPSLMTVGVV